MLGLNVARGRLPGASTLNGFCASSMPNACMRCDKPTPVWPATNAGTQPPLGVIETTQPFASAACSDVVPAMNAWSWVMIDSSSAAARLGRDSRSPVFEQLRVRIRLALERIGVARLDADVVLLPVDLREALAS